MPVSISKGVGGPSSVRTFGLAEKIIKLIIIFTALAYGERAIILLYHQLTEDHMLIRIARLESST